jgi:hypothetical protein
MKKLFLLALPSLFFFSCNDDKKTTAAAEEIKAMPLKIIDKVLGSFVGDFGDNKITLLITRAQGDTVEGRTVVGGNDRPFTGTIVEKDGAWKIAAREPGDDPNDGTFDFSIQTADPNVVSGSWKPYDAKKAAKTYTLQRKQFAYKPDVGDYPEASQRELKPKDVENMMKEDLEWMRNEIFARHGFCFRRKNLRDMFEELEWYIPDNTDIRNRLTDIEKKNLALIKRYEKYAEEYGDEYGR